MLDYGLAVGFHAEKVSANGRISCKVKLASSELIILVTTALSRLTS